MVIIVIVMCFVLKKNKRDVQQHIYDSVVSAVPAPTTHAQLISAASTTITDDDNVKKLSRDLQKYKLTCNVAYGSYKLAETTPNTDWSEWWNYQVSRAHYR